MLNDYFVLKLCASLPIPILQSHYKSNKVEYNITNLFIYIFIK